MDESWRGEEDRGPSPGKLYYAEIESEEISEHLRERKSREVAVKPEENAKAA